MGEGQPGPGYWQDARAGGHTGSSSYEKPGSFKDCLGRLVDRYQKGSVLNVISLLFDLFNSLIGGFSSKSQRESGKRYEQRGPD